LKKNYWDGVSHLRIDNEMLRSKVFGQFALTKEAAVWFHLCGWIIRGQMSSCGMGKKLYEDYYIKRRKLVARWDQKIIAEHLGLSKKSKGYISRLLRKLEEEWQVIKRIKIPSYSSHKINVYELGYIDDGGTERLHLVVKFRKLEVERRLAENYQIEKAG